MISYRFQLASALEKIFPCGEALPFDGKLSALWGEPAAFQIAYRSDYAPSGGPGERIHFEVDAGEGVTVRQRQVELVPSRYPCSQAHDDDYLTTAPGLFPDVLAPVPQAGVKVMAHQWRAVWVDLIPQDNSAPGVRTVHVKARCESVVWEGDLSLTIVGARLPAQKTYHTEWFHTDCLADYYHVDVFSEEHWRIIENFVRDAAEHGVNMLLTPVFTPPLDTAVGSERTTVQLVGVNREGEQWQFDFSKLDRWIEMAFRCGIRYIEISHLFTQWGAKHAPKIMARTDGRYQRVFGWETDARGAEYCGFLRQFLKELKTHLSQKGVLDQTWFHVSDEPNEEHLADYRAASSLLAECLGDCHMIDALSSIKLYQEGAVRLPVVSNDHIEPFLEAEVPGLWTYYCVSQSVDVSNRFMAQPSARNRILGVQMYLYQIHGFLHWGYNFYNSQFSASHIDPFCVTDAGESFPSGDPFVVYPGENGQPLDSLRLEVLAMAFADIRALEMLEGLAGREFVVSLIRAQAGERITFRQYPRYPEFLLRLRAKVNDAIACRLKS